MTDTLQQITKEEVTKLPSVNQIAIGSINWPSISEEIGRKFLLSDEELNDFQVQVLLVLIGLESMYDFSSSVEEEVGMSRNESEKISQEVTEKIFIPIANIGIENIKKDIKTKSPGWEKSVDFVLSGGDYSVYMDEGKKLDAEDAGEVVIPVFPYDKK